jgi:hypothetical protein
VPLAETHGQRNELEGQSMRRVVAARFAWGLVPALTVACAAGQASDEAADAGAVCEPGKVDLNGDPADGCEYACTPGPHAPDDPIDPSFVDENCDGSDGVVASCLFVAGSGADDFLGGTAARPLRSIPFAIDLARQKHRAVCLAGEAFPGLVVLASGVSVYGGFDATDKAFPFRRSESAHTSITAEGTVILASGIDADTHVEGVELHALVPADRATGLGAYGVRLTGGGATLFVRWTTIATDDARGGGDGAPGADGAPGIQGRKGQNGVSAAGGAAPGNGGSDGGEAVPSACSGAPSGRGARGAGTRAMAPTATTAASPPRRGAAGATAARRAASRPEVRAERGAMRPSRALTGAPGLRPPSSSRSVTMASSRPRSPPAARAARPVARARVAAAAAAG